MSSSPDRILSRCKPETGLFLDDGASLADLPATSPGVLAQEPPTPLGDQSSRRKRTGDDDDNKLEEVRLSSRRRIQGDGAGAGDESDSGGTGDDSNSARTGDDSDTQLRDSLRVGGELASGAVDISQPNALSLCLGTGCQDDSDETETEGDGNSDEIPKVTPSMVPELGEMNNGPSDPEIEPQDSEMVSHLRT